MFKIRLTLLLFIITCFLLVGSVSFSASFKELNPGAVVFKAGPTEPHEELSISWVEAVLYPKNVEAGKKFFVEVSLASSVKEVLAELDQQQTFSLYSKDKSNWNVIIPPQEQLEEGLHFLKVKIIGKSGRHITRTLVFRVGGGVGLSADKFSYPVLIKTDTRLSNGKMLKAGEKVEALYRRTFYWVKGADRTEGWVEASRVKEPKREIYVAGYQAYMNKEYDKAVAYYKKVLMLDPNNADANYWLAKSYDKVGEDAETVNYLMATLSIDPSHYGANLLAGRFAHNYFRKGRVLARMRKYKKAILNYEQAVALRPGSVSYWLYLGNAYKRSRNMKKAQEAWKQVLLIDPANKTVHALLRTDYYKLMAREEASIVRKAKRQLPKKSKSSNKLAKQYIKIVKQSRTNKGTTVASALKSVVSMTRSLGTGIYEEGWKTNLTTKGFLVTYTCRQERLGKFVPERFTFKVDLDSRRVKPHNKNARLLMHRW